MSTDRHAVAAARAKSLRRELSLLGDLTVRRTEGGGRLAPIHPRYVPDALLWGAPDTVPAGEPVHGCGVWFEGDPIPPGATREVELEPRHPEYWGAVSVGAELGLYEGERRTATFTVRRALPAHALRQWQEAESAATPSAREVNDRAKALAEATEGYVGRKRRVTLRDAE
jgi:hypothetical protein